MHFDVGDQVVYPSQGAGVVQEITSREVLGERHDYLKIVFARGDMEILVPLRKGREVGLRPTVGADELEQLEAGIAELEGAQATLTAALSTDEVAGDPDKLHQTSLAVQQVTDKLETSYSRWAELSDEVEKVRAKLGA